MTRTFIALVALVVSSAAAAADNGVYLGAGIVRSNIDTTSGAITQAVSSTRIDDSDNGFKIIAGIRPIDWLAVEMNYIDLGKVTVANPSVRADYSLTGVDAFGVLLFGVPFVDLYAKAGVIRWQADGGVASALATVRDSDSGFDPAYGVGVQAHFGSLGARLEYERFNVDNTDKTSALSLAVTWTFL